MLFSFAPAATEYSLGDFVNLVMRFIVTIVLKR